MHAGGPGVRNGRPERLDILLRRGGQHRLQRLLAHTPQLTRRLAGDVAAPGRLNGDGDLCLHLEPARAQALEHARGEEDARLAAAELLAGHAELLEQRQHAVLGRLARELRLGAETGNHEEVAAKLVKGHAVGESGAGDTQRVEHARRVELARDDGVLDQVGLLLVVGLEAAHEVQVALVERADEVRELRREGVGDALELGRLELLPVARRGRHVRRLGEELLEQLVVGELHQHDEVAVERVLVLVEPGAGAVVDQAGKVVDAEAVLWADALHAHDDAALSVLRHHLLGEALVRALWQDALLGEEAEEARLWRLERLDEVGVVAVRDVCHVDALLLVRLHGLGEDGLGEERLQLLVGKVDAQLLHRVLLEDLEAKDVDDTDDILDGRVAVAALGLGHRRVDLLDQLVEEPREDALGQRVARVHGLGEGEVLVHHLGANLHLHLGQHLWKHAPREAQHGLDVLYPFGGVSRDGRRVRLCRVEVDVARVEAGGDQRPQLGQPVGRPAARLERLVELIPEHLVGPLATRLARVRPVVVEVKVVGGLGCQLERRDAVSLAAPQQRVKGVVRALAWPRRRHAGLLEQVGVESGALNL
mmetsp:Transcript_49202/g.155764  ORF Transcript_49202/g.155764 Transcript_49202/m.155764 type:complete len:592 (+) Transcript_49202:1942-3717(+)